MPNIHLSMRLAKKGVTLSDIASSAIQMTRHPFLGGMVLTGQKLDQAPDWLPLIQQESGLALPKLRTKSCSAAYLLEVTDKNMKYVVAYTFGTAHHAIDEDLFESSFGLRVALNSIANTDLRNIDVASLDTSTLRKRLQASKATDVGDFGIDYNQDLLRLASGRGKDSTFAKSITGKDALSFSCIFSKGCLEEKAKKAIQTYKLDDYKTDYPWIDHIELVKDQTTLDPLDSELIKQLEKLCSGKDSDLQLSLPDIGDPESQDHVSYFGKGMSPGQKKTYLDIDIDDYVSEVRNAILQKTISFSDIKSSHKMMLWGQAKPDPIKVKLYKCFNLEVLKKNIRYILFGGSWYKIDKAHAKNIEAAYRSFLRKKPLFGTTTAQNERQYISQLNSRADLLNLDQVKINPAGSTRANIEPCDFFSKKKQLIHLKDAHASTSLSHLWNQGHVSASLLMLDASFRGDLVREAKKRELTHKRTGFSTLLPTKSSPPLASKYTVVFGVMRKRNKGSKSLDIPFFSKISLQPPLNAIKLMNFKVEIDLIEKV